MMLRTRLILSFFLVLVPTYSFAALDVSVTMNPINPAPYQETTITLTSTSFDVNGAMITWKNAGTTLLSGLGAKKLTVTAGASGQEAEGLRNRPGPTRQHPRIRGVRDSGMARGHHKGQREGVPHQGVHPQRQPRQRGDG